MNEELNDSARPICLPRVQVADLFVLTASFAIGLAIQEARAHLGLSKLSVTEYQLFNVVSRSVLAAISGLPLSVVYFFYRRFKRKAVSPPGQWLLVSALCISIGDTVQLLTATIPQWLLFFRMDANIIYQTLPLVFSLCSAGLLFWAGNTCFAAWRKVLFLSAFANVLSSACYSVLLLFTLIKFENEYLLNILVAIDWADVLLNFLIAFSLIKVTISEVTNRTGRALWHWLGVLVELLTVTAVPMLGFVYSRLGNWQS